MVHEVQKQKYLIYKCTNTEYLRINDLKVYLNNPQKNMDWHDAFIFGTNDDTAIICMES